MSHCKACDAPIRFEYIEDVADADGNPVVEDMCGRCKTQAHLNMPEGYYDGMWLDKNGHESHIVHVDPMEYLI